MANGELLFEAPWQGRVFAIARILCEQGLYHWDDFRKALIRRIDDWDQNQQRDEPYAYYDHFLAALTDLLEDKALFDLSELTSRDALLNQRPHGHDH